MTNTENSTNEAKPEDTENTAKHIQPTYIEQEMQKSYLSYAMSVIVGRALPDVKDGLKPVHRRILFAMHEMGMFHNKPYKKSARIVGEVLGKYHPHGDTAVYDAMVRMAQDFSMRYPLIDGQGNFGSIDGDSAAAMRYTEARLSKLAEEMLEDIKKETVEFIPNFDASLQEPKVLPAKVPNLLLNGSSGIAVGMATNIPPHNMNELCDGIIEVIDNPEISINELMKIIPGPDFPTGGTVTNISGIKKAYSTGRGVIRVKAVAYVEDYKNRERIIIREIPYNVNKALLIEEIAELVRNKKIDGIKDIRDESDREGIRIVIEVKKDANAEIILNQLYKHTRMQISFGINMLALVENEPKTLSLKEIIEEFISHRISIVTKRTQFDLKKAEEKAHILEGLIIALNDIDNVIKTIKESKDIPTAQQRLMQNYELTEVQSKAILEMRLSKLASLEQERIRQDYDETMELIKKLKEILADKQKILDIIKEELKYLKEKYGDKRRTKITEIDEDDIEIEDLIEKEDMVVTISHKGYIKRTSLKEYREQQRGGKGILASGTKDEDFLEHLFIANTHSYLLVFTNKGRVHWIKVYQVPEGSRQSKGKAIVNLIELQPEEKVETVIPVKEFEEEQYLIMITKKGIIKKTTLAAFSRPRKGGIIALKIDEGDELVSVRLTHGNSQILIATAKGMAIRFKENDVRSIGRNARGVIGVRLRKGDYVVGAVVADDTKTLLTVTENGYGKRTVIKEYRLIKRGGVGVKNIITDERNGNVVSVQSVTEEDSVMLISKNGIIIRVPCKGISLIGRNTKGVRIMKLKDGDKVVACAKVVRDYDKD